MDLSESMFLYDDLTPEEKELLRMKHFLQQMFPNHPDSVDIVLATRNDRVNWYNIARAGLVFFPHDCLPFTYLVY